ncbi:MAG: allantoate amidohydrolase [Alsobacter sp.]
MPSSYPSLPYGSRAFARLEALRRFTDVPGQIHRLYLSPAHRLAVDAVADMMRAAGCDSVHVDALGTVVGRYEAVQPGHPALMIGSHIDSVKDAGAYDGTFGVVAGIGIVEVLHETGRRLPFAVELLAFGDEENVRFPTTLSSSRALAGTFDPAALDGRDEAGVRFADALVQFGGDAEGIAGLARRREDVLGYVELHIEQGPVLDGRDLPVGVVTAIAGSTRFRVRLTGTAGHAGTVPMGMRHDALAAAAEMILAVERVAGEVPGTVATVGRIAAEPGAVNVIPGGASFTIDARAPVDADRHAMVATMTTALQAIAVRRGVGLVLESFLESAACPCDGQLRARLSAAISRRQIPVLELASGAGHDAMAMAALCPVGMLFVRCAGGISHNPAESMTIADADVAIAVLLDFVLAFQA